MTGSLASRPSPQRIRHNVPCRASAWQRSRRSRGRPLAALLRETKGATARRSMRSLRGGSSRSRKNKISSRACGQCGAPAKRARRAAVGKWASRASRRPHGRATARTRGLSTCPPTRHCPQARRRWWTSPRRRRRFPRRPLRAARNRDDLHAGQRPATGCPRPAAGRAARCKRLHGPATFPWWARRRDHRRREDRGAREHHAPQAPAAEPTATLRSRTEGEARHHDGERLHGAGVCGEGVGYGSR